MVISIPNWRNFVWRLWTFSLFLHSSHRKKLGGRSQNNQGWLTKYHFRRLGACQASRMEHTICCNERAWTRGGAPRRVCYVCARFVLRLLTDEQQQLLIFANKTWLWFTTLNGLFWLFVIVYFCMNWNWSYEHVLSRVFLQYKKNRWPFCTLLQYVGYTMFPSVVETLGPLHIIGKETNNKRTFMFPYRASPGTSVLYLIYPKQGESNGKLPLRTCPGCSVPEPYQSPDWTLVSAQTGPRAEYQ